MSSENQGKGTKAILGTQSLRRCEQPALVPRCHGGQSQTFLCSHLDPGREWVAKGGQGPHGALTGCHVLSVDPGLSTWMPLVFGVWHSVPWGLAHIWRLALSLEYAHQIPAAPRPQPKLSLGVARCPLGAKITLGYKSLVVAWLKPCGLGRSPSLHPVTQELRLCSLVRPEFLAPLHPCLHILV
jgi:hypothetical protein